MRLFKKILPLLFLFNLGYSQDWKLSENEYLIKHKNQEYHSKLAKMDHAVAYYIYKINQNGEREVIGDEIEEIQDYKDLALASHFNFNKDKILLRINNDLEMFRQSNKSYKIGIVLNKLIEELTELDTKLLLHMGSYRDVVKKEILKDYSIKVKEFSKNFINDVINDKDKINSLDDLVKKLEKKIFNSTSVGAKENIKKLETRKKILSANNILSTKEAKLAEKIISECTIKGYSTSAFQDAYLVNIDEIGYQLTNVGSSMLKSFPEGKRVYDFIKRFGIDGIEEIDSEAIKKSLKKMKEVHERISLSMNLYKKNLDPSINGSNANLLINDIAKDIKVDWYGGLMIRRGNPKGGMRIEDKGILLSLLQNKDEEGFTYITLNKNLKNKKNHYLSFKIKFRDFYEYADYYIAIGPFREPLTDESVFGVYSSSRRGLENNWIDWDIEIDYQRGIMKIDSKNANLEYKINYDLPMIQDLSKWKNWYFKIILGNYNSFAKPIQAVIMDFRYQSK